MLALQQMTLPPAHIKISRKKLYVFLVLSILDQESPPVKKVKLVSSKAEPKGRKSSGKEPKGPKAKATKSKYLILHAV